MAYPDGDQLDVETWWVVTEHPVTRPFSIMGHLVSPQGETLDRFDGLGISPLDLVAQDVIVQRHRFAGHPGAEIWLRTGAYWQDTMERWPLLDRPEADAILVPLLTEQRR
jgi:hypothetical protein